MCVLGMSSDLLGMSCDASCDASCDMSCDVLDMSSCDVLGMSRDVLGMSRDMSCDVLGVSLHAEEVGVPVDWT